MSPVPLSASVFAQKSVTAVPDDFVEGICKMSPFPDMHTSSLLPPTTVSSLFLEATYIFETYFTKRSRFQMNRVILGISKTIKEDFGQKKREIYYKTIHGFNDIASLISKY